MISVRSKVQIFPGPPIPGGALPLGMRGTWENRDEDGAIAQLGERLLCKQEVVGSIPSGSTRLQERSPGTITRNDHQERSTSNVEEYGFAAIRGGFLDIVKKGYAQDAGKLPCHSGHYSALLRLLRQAWGGEAWRGSVSALTARSGLGLSRCKLVFLEAVFTSRDG